MINLENYANDGANYQARAVLAFLQGLGKIENSWNDECHSYDADPRVSRWENCREQGYVIMLRNSKGAQLNLAFFEHRNSDSICAIEWVQNTINAPTIDTAVFGDVYKDKYDVSHSVEYGQALEMAEWLKSRMEYHWEKGANS